MHTQYTIFMASHKQSCRNATSFLLLQTPNKLKMATFVISPLKIHQRLMDSKKRSKVVKELVQERGRQKRYVVTRPMFFVFAVF